MEFAIGTCFFFAFILSLIALTYRPHLVMLVLKKSAHQYDPKSAKANRLFGTNSTY